MVKIEVEGFGTMTFELYPEEAPITVDNFLKYVNEGFYDGLTFHRIYRGFMIQGGDPNSKNPVPGASYGTGGPDYTIEAEISPSLFHKRGALAAARQGDEVNPDRRSSGSQFYIAWGKVYNQGQLSQLAKQLEVQAQQQILNRLAMEHKQEIIRLRKERDQQGLMELQDDLIAQTKAIAKEQGVKGLTEEQKKLYSTIGGVPHLDGQYTVFGEVTEGLDVVEKIQNTRTLSGDRPADDIVMRVTVVE